MRLRLLRRRLSGYPRNTQRHGSIESFVRLIIRDVALHRGWQSRCRSVRSRGGIVAPNAKYAKEVLRGGRIHTGLRDCIGLLLLVWGGALVLLPLMLRLWNLLLPLRALLLPRLGLGLLSCCADT